MATGVTTSHSINVGTIKRFFIDITLHCQPCLEFLALKANITCYSTTRKTGNTITLQVNSSITTSDQEPSSTDHITLVDRALGRPLLTQSITEQLKS